MYHRLQLLTIVSLFIDFCIILYFIAKNKIPIYTSSKSIEDHATVSLASSRDASTVMNQNMNRRKSCDPINNEKAIERMNSGNQEMPNIVLTDVKEDEVKFDSNFEDNENANNETHDKDKTQKKDKSDLGIIPEESSIMNSPGFHSHADIQVRSYCALLGFSLS